MQLIHCDSLEFETWLAPPQEDFPRPTWTKLFVNGQLISNSIEYADWQNDPMGLTVCEQCWGAECAMCGYARIVRLDSQVLWLRPREELLPEYVQDSFTYDSVVIDAPLLMPRQVWGDLTDQFSMVPAFEELKPPTQLDLLWLWMETIPIDIHRCLTLSPLDLTELPTLLRQNSLASDPLDLPESISAIQTLIDAASNDELVTDYSIVPLNAEPDETIKFYLDGKQFPEWKALTLSQSELILGNTWVVSRNSAGTLEGT